MPDALELVVDSKWVIRQLRDSGRTQAELARYLNLTPPQISKTLGGRRKIQAGEADLIREFFRAAAPTLPQAVTKRIEGPSVDANIAALLGSVASRSLPIYGSVTAGGRLLTMEKPVNHALRPRRLENRDDVFALYVDDTQMGPEFEPGRLILVESARPPAPGDSVVIQIKSENPDTDDSTVIKRLVSMDAENIHLIQHNPPRPFDIPRHRIERMWRVMTIDDLLNG